MPASTAVSRLPALATLALAACSIGQPSGQPFDQAFPDPGELVTTADPAAVHKRLADTAVPDSAAHRERLAALLAARSELTGAHLALLARAAMHSTRSMCSTGNGTWRWCARGEGAQAAAIDRLLLDGLGRVTTVDRRWYGELIGLSQSDATLRALFDRFHARVDDGSTPALTAILRGMPGSPATRPFVDQLFAAGKLADPERAWAVLAAVDFDDDRTAVLAALVTHGVAITGDRLVAAMKLFSFDDGRTQAFALLAAKADALSFDQGRAAIATFSFDDGRQAAAATFGKRADLALTDDQLVTLARMFSFDDGRAGCVRALAARLTGEPDAAAARALLSTFSFDDGRLSTVKAMARRWNLLTADERRGLLAAFSFDSNRTQALPLLMK
ncbi:MAG: DUF4476 domain-containing protein [Planctomycetota bacterium]